MNSTKAFGRGALPPAPKIETKLLVNLFLKVEQKMVCLFGIALQASAEKNVTSKFWNDFTLWNWLVHDLAVFMYSKSSEIKPAPHIP